MPAFHQVRARVLQRPHGLPEETPAPGPGLSEGGALYFTNVRALVGGPLYKTQVLRMGPQHGSSNSHQGRTATLDACCYHLPVRTILFSSYLILRFLLGQISFQQRNPRLTIKQSRVIKINWSKHKHNFTGHSGPCGLKGSSESTGQARGYLNELPKLIITQNFSLQYFKFSYQLYPTVRHK